MLWTIYSYVGVNSLKFGMQPDEVAYMIGQPKNTRPSGALNIREFRGLEDPVVVYAENLASEIVFSKETFDLSFRGMKVFQEEADSVLARLSLLDSNLLESSAGTIFSRELGVSLSGFQDEDDSNKSFCAFARGLWDSHVANARPIKI